MRSTGYGTREIVTVRVSLSKIAYDAQRVAVARLADRAGVHEVAHAGLEAEAERGAVRQDRLDRVGRQAEDHGEVRVPEEAEGEGRLPEHVQGLDLAEDVGVLVDRRAVGDRELAVHDDRPLRAAPAASAGSQA